MHWLMDCEVRGVIVVGDMYVQYYTCRCVVRCRCGGGGGDGDVLLRLPLTFFLALI